MASRGIGQHELDGSGKDDAGGYNEKRISILFERKETT